MNYAFFFLIDLVCKSSDISRVDRKKSQILLRLFMCTSVYVFYSLSNLR